MIMGRVRWRNRVIRVVRVYVNGDMKRKLEGLRE